MNRSKCLSTVLCVVSLMSAGTAAHAGVIGVEFNYSLDMSYVYAPDVGGKVGELTLSAPTAALVTKYDLGLDGYGGGNDVILDRALIGDSNDVAFEMTLDVIKLAANTYSLTGMMGGTDTDLLSDSHVAEVISGTASYFPGTLLISGALAVGPQLDSILVNRAIGPYQWLFAGLTVPNPGVDPDEDLVEGQLSLLSGRTAFDTGSYSLLALGVDSVADLDAFFGMDRFHAASDLKLQVVPEPATMLLLTVGGLALAVRRRR